MSSAGELTGYSAPLEDGREGFKITVYRPRRVTPAQFFTGLMIMLGLDSSAPGPHEVEALQLESQGQEVHVEMLLTDGRMAVVDVPLDCGIRGLL